MRPRASRWWFQVNSNVVDQATVTNSASVNLTSTDSNSANNSASQSVTVQVPETVVATTTALASSLNPATSGQIGHIHGDGECRDVERRCSREAL